MNKKPIEELVEDRKNVGIQDFRVPIIPWEATLGAFVGVCTAKFGNYFKKLPLNAGLSMYVGFTGIGFLAGYRWHDFVLVRRTKMDIQMQTYMETYPERFPELKKKVPKFGDAEVLAYWKPIRRAQGP